MRSIIEFRSNADLRARRAQEMRERERQRLVSPKHRQTLLRSALASTRLAAARLAPAYLAIAASLVAMISTCDHVAAANGRNARATGLVEQSITRETSEPIMAIVSLRTQRITVYDANGWILRAPVSSGQKGRETPAGIFSVLQKEAEHYSNLYDDAYMPHMQRITWSGIALHGGPLPGHPASHGCVRMPYDFARHLFGMTRLGMRVVVAPGDVVPIEIVHPGLFPIQPGPGSIAATRAAEANEAARNVDQAKLATTTASREAARAMMRVAENLKLGAQAQLAADPAAVVAELEAQWAAAKSEVQSKFDAVASAREAVAKAENARAVAAEAARKAALDLEPVSVFISRKTQRLYVRQAFQPILDSPVTIRDADRPIGTHVFTAIAGTGSDVDMRWSAVSLSGGRADARADQPRGRGRGRRGQGVEPMATDLGAATAALDRIVIPQDALDRIATIGSPRASLIISDEALSPETGKDTEFVVVMSGEPQGGIKFRHHGPEAKVPHQRSRGRSA
jgi:L,D-transpeptidase-like protein